MKTDTPRTDALERANHKKDVYSSFFQMRDLAWNLERELAAVTEQRDRLAEAMRQMRSSGDIVICSQSATNLTTNTQTQPKLIHNGVGIADMYSRDEFENAMKRTQ